VKQGGRLSLWGFTRHPLYFRNRRGGFRIRTKRKTMSSEARHGSGANLDGAMLAIRPGRPAPKKQTHWRRETPPGIENERCLQQQRSCGNTIRGEKQKNGPRLVVMTRWDSNQHRDKKKRRTDSILDVRGRKRTRAGTPRSGPPRFLNPDVFGVFAPDVAEKR